MAVYETLVLYQDDFCNDKTWRDVCDSLEVSPDEGDTVKVQYAKATIATGDEWHETNG